jgi:hypothetical protein
MRFADERSARGKSNQDFYALDDGIIRISRGCASVPVCGATRRPGRDRPGKYLKLQW